MNAQRTLSTITALAALAIMAAPHAHAAPILMDFGTTDATGAGNAANSPAHEDGGVTGTTWNSFAADKNAGFVDAQNNPVTGLSVDFGVETTTNSKVVNYATAVKGVNMRGNQTLFFDGDGDGNTTLQEDFVVRDSGSDQGLAIAISGLADGTYDLYLTSFFNPQSSAEYVVYATTGASAVTDFSNLASVGTITNDSTTFGSSNDWIAGDNYLKFSVTVDDTMPVVSLFIDGIDGDNPKLGLANTLVIVPEPASLAMLGLGAALIASRRRA